MLHSPLTDSKKAVPQQWGTLRGKPFCCCSEHIAIVFSFVLTNKPMLHQHKAIDYVWHSSVSVLREEIQRLYCYLIDRCFNLAFVLSLAARESSKRNSYWEHTYIKNMSRSFRSDKRTRPNGKNLRCFNFSTPA